MSFDELAEQIKQTGDEAGLRLVSNQRENIEKASCTSCEKNKATARLRVWLAKYENVKLQ